MRKSIALAVLGLALLAAPGCGVVLKPFEPVKLEQLDTNEEGFLIPLTGDAKKQDSTNNEQFLKANLVAVKQVRVPQQWVPLGYQYVSYNGKWQDAAVLIKVDTSPVTKVWTADPATGTANVNQAIWGQTNDPVEFSTGWTITARIKDRDDAVKFLHNYPSGSLAKVMDTEIHAKLTAEFGEEVTDLSMDAMRKAATPHVVAIRKRVTDFFKDRGIQITNLGITGGFVFKEDTIRQKMISVFNAESDKLIAISKTQAQTETNKTIKLEAEAKAAAILVQRRAEADGIEAVTKARKGELDAAKDNLATYLGLKKIEVMKTAAEKWDGTLPRTILGGAGESPNLLLPLEDPAKPAPPEGPR